jgi:L-lysine exporter family protein LysE/ArgO
MTLMIPALSAAAPHIEDQVPAMFAAGLLFGSASLLSIGPNTVMLLREGLVRGRPLTIACAVWGSYAVLLSTAIAGGHVVRPVVETLAPLLSWGGAAVLAYFGLSTLRAAAAGRRGFVFGEAGTESVLGCAKRALRVVWSNPLTYLELLLVPAILVLPVADLVSRLALLAGLLVVFALNCFGFALGATAIAPLVRSPDRLRHVDRGSGILMLLLAALAAVSAAHPEAAG